MAKKFYANDLRLRAAVDQVKAGTTQAFPIAKGLTCVVTKAGAARFVHRYPFGGGYKTVWLDGTYPRDVMISQAIEWAAANNAALDDHIDPAVARVTGEKADPTLAEYCRTHYEALATPADIADFGIERSRFLAETIGKITVGTLGDMKIDAIRRCHVIAAVEKYWDGKTARPVGRRAVANLAKVLKHRHTLQDRGAAWENPADWEAIAFKLGGEEYFGEERASLDFEDVPAFVRELRKRETMSARCLEWVVFTGCRVAEATGATWGEIDWSGRRAWVIPAARLKTERRKGKKGKDFVVPLSLGLLAILKRAAENRTDLGPDDLIFPGWGMCRSAAAAKAKGQKPARYSQMAIWRLLQVMRPGLTVHGFRSTFVSWGIAIPHRARAPFDLAVMDRAIGHVIGAKTAYVGGSTRLSSVVARYANKAGGDPLVQQRRVVMREWAAYIDGTPRPTTRAAVPVPSNVTPLRLAA